MSKKFRILSTSDIHGVIYPYAYADGTEANEGLARIRTLIESLRDEDTIVIDNGDTIEGSPFTFYHYAYKDPLSPCPLSKAMKVVGYDYMVPGNHDFNYGEAPFFKHIKETGATVLCANLFYKGELLGPEYVIRENNGKKLALFGLVTHYVPMWEEEGKIANFTFTDAFETCKKTVEKIKEKEAADYIVCVYHGGFERDPETDESCENNPGEDQAYRMGKEIKGLSAIMTGHQHREMCGSFNGVAYTQPFQHGAFLASIDINTMTNVVIPSLIPADIYPDEEIMKLCEADEKEVQKWLDTPLGTTDIDMLIHDEYESRLHKSQLATFFNKIQKEISGADLSGISIFLKAKGLGKQITMRSLMSTYFFPNTLVVKKINGRILREYLERTALFWEMKDGEIIINPLMDYPTPQYHNYDFVDDIEYTIKVSNEPGHKIIEMNRHGVPIKDDDEFTLAINNYRASGSGGYEMIHDAPTVKEINRSVVDLIGEYIKDHKDISFKPLDNIKVIK